MLLFRVFLHDPTARSGKSGNAMYLHRPQGSGRWDNPALYDAWYLASTAEGAIGESFGNIPEWTEDMLEHPAGLRRTLATFSVPDDLSVFNFDDATNLLHVGMRPSDVVIRNKGFTQSKAAQLFAEQRQDGTRKWAGVRWWSFHRPSWTKLMLWVPPTEPPPFALASQEELTMSSTSIVEAATALCRPLH